MPIYDNSVGLRNSFIGSQRRPLKRMSYTDQIPDYDAGDNPLGDVQNDKCDMWVGKSTQDVKESYMAGQLSRSAAYAILVDCFLQSDLEANDLLDEADREMLADRDQDGIPDDIEDIVGDDQGGIFEPPSDDTSTTSPTETKDFRLIGAIAILFFGGLIIRSFRK